MSATLERYQLNRPAPITIASDAQHKLYYDVFVELESRDHLSSDDKKYARLLAALIEKYERERFPIANASPVEVLTELMEANNLRQKDLIFAFGTESVVSEVLSGKRSVNLNQVRKLCERFRISADAFLG